MVNQRVPVASADNPLGLPLDNDRQASALKVMALDGEEHPARITQCTAFFTFLGSLDRYVQAFNRLPRQQQIIAVLIQEEYEDQPNFVKDHYLQASADLWERAIVRCTKDGLLTAVVMTEVALRHIAEFFRT